MKNEAYQYLECGLPNVYLQDGFTRQKTPYGEGVSIDAVGDLHRCIAQTLCDKPSPLTGLEFKYLRIELDLSQKVIAELLGCDDRNIRRIEKSEKVKGLYDKVIRLLYLESTNPESTFIGLFERLRSIDVHWHDIKLASDQNHGWTSTA